MCYKLIQEGKSFVRKTNPLLLLFSLELIVHVGWRHDLNCKGEFRVNWSFLEFTRKARSSFRWKDFISTASNSWISSIWMVQHPSSSYHDTFPHANSIFIQMPVRQLVQMVLNWTVLGHFWRRMYCSRLVWICGYSSFCVAFRETQPSEVQSF